MNTKRRRRSIAMGRVIRWRRRLALVIPLVAVCVVWSSHAAMAQVPLTYTITALASDGTQGTVTFQGVANGAQLTGAVQGQDVSLEVAGTIGTNGSVSGTLSQDGVKRGVFWGGPNGLRFWGSFDLSGKVGNWSAAGPKLPVPIGP